MPDDLPKKKRAFNFRPMVSAAFAVLLGALTGAAFNLNDTALTVGLAISAAAVVAAFVFFRKRKRFLGFILVFVLGFVAMTVDLNVSEVEYYETAYAEVRGRVCKETVETDYSKRFYIDTLTIDGTEKFGVMEVEIPDGIVDPEYTIGDCVVTYCSLESVDLSPFSSDFARYDKLGVTYKGVMKFWRMPEGKAVYFNEKVMLKLDGVFAEVMTKDEAGIMKSLLFGDKSNLSAGDYSNIKAAGLAHIFAVSGLHIGFLVGVAAFVLKKLRANDFIICIALAVILILYGYLCGFTASLLRASVMTAVVFIAKIFRQRPDRLSNLATAVFILVLINPTTVFDVGFQMSASAVAGIILFAEPISKKLRFAVKSRAVSDSVAMSVSSTLGLFPVMTNVFNTFAVYFVLANLVCLPIVGVLFIYLAFAVVICLAVPAAAPILYPAKYLGFAVMRIVEFAASLPYAVIGTMSMGAVAVVYAVTLANLSRYNMLDKRDKTYLTVVSIAAGLLIFILFYSGITFID